MKKIAGYIFCSGSGTRLRPRTYEVPKCLLKIKGEKTFLDWNLEWFQSNGVRKIFVNASYNLEQFQKVISKYNDLEITILMEDSPLGHGNSILSVKDKVKDYDFLIGVNGDTLLNPSLQELVGEWNDHEYLRIVGSKATGLSENVILSEKKVIGYISPTKTVVYDQMAVMTGMAGSVGLFVLNPRVYDLGIEYDKSEFLGMFGTDDLLEKVYVKGGYVSHIEISDLKYYGSVNTEEEYQNLIKTLAHDK